MSQSHNMITAKFEKIYFAILTMTKHKSITTTHSTIKVRKRADFSRLTKFLTVFAAHSILQSTEKMHDRISGGKARPRTSSTSALLK
jgi:hypothetical protein